MFENIKLSKTLKLVSAGLSSSGLLLLIAMAVYPNYNQIEQTISKLGNLWPSSFFFSVALLIEVVTLIYLLFKLKTGLPNLLTDHKQKLKLIFLLFILMNLCMIGVVIFPSKGATSDIHDAIAISLFISMAIGTSWTSSITSSGLKNWNKYVSYLGYICSISVLILGYLLAFGEFGPIFQKITVVLFTCWVIMMVYELQKYPELRI
jgi:hypothetical protein